MGRGGGEVGGIQVRWGGGQSAGSGGVNCAWALQIFAPLPSVIPTVSPHLRERCPFSNPHLNWHLLREAPFHPPGRGSAGLFGPQALVSLALP